MGGPADYLASIFQFIAARKPEEWYSLKCLTPCGDRDIFTSSEWGMQDWWNFHELITKCSSVAQNAISVNNEGQAIASWQAILGKDYFPVTVS